MLSADTRDAAVAFRQPAGDERRVVAELSETGGQLSVVPKLGAVRSGSIRRVSTDQEPYPRSLADTEAANAERQGEVARRDDYVPGLDGLRAFAVIAVWLLHMDRAHFPGGAVGVDVFFALSAYLITGLLLKERERRPVSLASFYWRRAFRLFPALVLCIALVAIPSMLVNHQTSEIPWAGGALLYVNDFLATWTTKVPVALDQTWSLAVEEQFYLVWPVLLLFVLPRVPRERGWVPFAVLAVAAVGILQWGGFTYFLPTGHLLPLVLGAWAAVTRTGSKATARVPVAAARIAAAVLLLAVFINTAGATALANAAIGVATAIAATTLILYLDSAQASLLKRLFEHPLAVWLGARSYGIYLYGLSLIGLVSGVTHLKLHFAVFVDVLATLAVVTASYEFVEAPIRRRGRRWLASRSAQVGPQSGPP